MSRVRSYVRKNVAEICWERRKSRRRSCVRKNAVGRDPTVRSMCEFVTLCETLETVPSTPKADRTKACLDLIRADARKPARSAARRAAPAGAGNVECRMSNVGC
jgi:hypothetical protein